MRENVPHLSLAFSNCLNSLNTIISTASIFLQTTANSFFEVKQNALCTMDWKHVALYNVTVFWLKEDILITLKHTITHTINTHITDVQWSENVTIFLYFLNNTDLLMCVFLHMYKSRGIPEEHKGQLRVGSFLLACVSGYQLIRFGGQNAFLLARGQWHSS